MAGVGLVERPLVSSRQDAECVDRTVVDPLEVVDEDGRTATAGPAAEAGIDENSFRLRGDDAVKRADAHGADQWPIWRRPVR